MHRMSIMNTSTMSSVSASATNLTFTIVTFYNYTMGHIEVIDLCKTVFYCLFGVIIAISNLLTIIAIYQFKYLHTSTYTFVLSLSIADFLLFPPLAGLRFIGYIHDDTAVQVLNAILLALLCLSLNMSFMSLLAVAVDRYKAVLQPYSYKASVTVTKARLSVLCMWTYGVITMVPVVIYYTLQKSSENLRKEQAIAKILPLPAYIVLVAAQSVIYVIISIVIYIRVFLELRHRARNKMRLRGVSGDASKTALSTETKRTTKMMALVLGSIVLTWLPFTIVSTVSCFIKQSVTIHTAYTLTIMILYANSFLNPLIYAWRSPLFRKAYASLISCGRCELDALRVSQECSSSD